MIAYLVSALDGDIVPGGINIALSGGIEALQDPAIQAWMSEQGFGPDDPDECMYLATEVPEGFPHLEVTLYVEDAGRYRAAVARRLREYRFFGGERDALVRAAAAAGINKRQISIKSGLSRQTVYNILGGPFGADSPQGTDRVAPPRTHQYAGSSKERQSAGLPGHCKKCATVGHVKAHPDLGCGDVGCERAHWPGKD